NAPDALAVAVDLGVVAGPDPEAVPGAARQVVQAAGQVALQETNLPMAVFGEGLQSLPVQHPVDADKGLGDGVLFDVEQQSDRPLDEASLAFAREARRQRHHEPLQQRPQSRTLHFAPPESPWVFDAYRQGLSGRCSCQPLLLGHKYYVLSLEYFSGKPVG